VDTAVYRPTPRDEARRQLKLDPDALLLGFACENQEDPRKGGHLLEKALEACADLAVTTISVGGGNKGVGTISLGRIDSDTHLALFYSAVDAFVLPSLQDNLPNTILESMACGTPCIAFDCGGVPDMVRPEETGWLAACGDSSALAAAIREAAGNAPERERRGRAARALVESEFEARTQALHYAALYRQMKAC